MSDSIERIFGRHNGVLTSLLLEIDASKYNPAELCSLWLQDRKFENCIRVRIVANRAACETTRYAELSLRSTVDVGFACNVSR